MTTNRSNFFKSKAFNKKIENFEIRRENVIKGKQTILFLIFFHILIFFTKKKSVTHIELCFLITCLSWLSCFAFKFELFGLQREVNEERAFLSKP